MSKENITGVSSLKLENFDPEAIIAMDSMLFKLRDDCPQTALLDDSSYRKLRVAPSVQSRLHSIYEGSRHGIVLVFERENKDAYLIHKGRRVNKVEIPLTQVADFMKPGEAGRFLIEFMKFCRDPKETSEELENLDELYDEESLFGRFA